MILSTEWKDYEILDMANGEKLERWGNIYLIRQNPNYGKKLMLIITEANLVVVNGNILKEFLTAGKSNIKI